MKRYNTVELRIVSEVLKEITYNLQSKELIKFFYSEDEYYHLKLIILYRMQKVSLGHPLNGQKIQNLRHIKNDLFLNYESNFRRVYHE